MSESDALVSRVRKRMLILGGVEIAAGFAFGWRAGVSLTIAAAVVIFSFLVLERLTERLVPGQDRKGFLTVVPLLLVTAASLVLFGIVLFRWKAFNAVAGAVGVSTVLFAILPELVIGGRGKE